MTLEAEVCALLLAGWAKEATPDFEKVEKAVRLDQYYIPTRYPTGLPGGVPSRFYTDPEKPGRLWNWLSQCWTWLRKD